LAEKMQKYVHTIHEAKSVACVPDTMLWQFLGLFS
jgi:hypothetical protein